MPLDLSGLQDFIEEEMVDTVKITRDIEGSTDDTFDEQTGQYTPPVPDLAVIYQGQALVMELNVFPTQTTEGGAATLSTDFELHIPLASQKLMVNDLIEVLACDRTPHLVGEQLTVRSVEASTFSVSQKARVYNKKQKILQ